MLNHLYQTIVENFFEKASIQINGNRPCDVQITDQRFYKRIIKDGRLGLGESYMDKWWECERIDEMLFHLLQAVSVYKKTTWIEFLKFKFSYLLKANIFPDGAKSRSGKIGDFHYDLGHDFFKLILDRRLTYSCAYWQGAQTLDEAQEAKLDLICRKLKIEPGMSILDVGCGWGSFAKYAAEKYHVNVTGITISQKQCDYAQKICLGLPAKILYEDYRDVVGKFDRIISVEMFEHVGPKYYKIFIKKMYACLNDNGIFLLQTSGLQRDTVKFSKSFLLKYIFPGVWVPSLKKLTTILSEDFVVEDFQNIGADYDRTIMEWYKNFEHNQAKITSQYNDRFYRMWKFFLLMSAAIFRARYLQLWQIVLSKDGLIGGYSVER